MDREGQVALSARGVRFAPQPLDELFARMRAIALQYQEREELLRLGRTPRAITDAHAPHTHLERAEEEDLQRVGALRRARWPRGPPRAGGRRARRSLRPRATPRGRPRRRREARASRRHRCASAAGCRRRPASGTARPRRDTTPPTRRTRRAGPARTRG